MKRIKLSNKGVALVDDKDYDRLSKWTWRLDRYGYATNVRRIDGKCKTIFMHRCLIDAPKGIDIDHINRNPLDNRRVNLRQATRSQNCVNSKLRVNNRSGYKGVSWDRSINKWRAQAYKNGKQIYLGVYDSIEEAVKVRKLKAIELYGKFIND